ncbi:MAG: ABC transporter ATP-binding protein [Alphaproteobacteria bacterium]|nr:ABC transporter ATP-binding protein [Alphaproteobacteria bacterium]
MTETQIFTPFQFFRKSLKDHKYKVAGLFLCETLQAAFLLLLPFVIRDLIDAVQTYRQGAGPSIWEVINEPFWRFVWVNIGLVFFSRATGMILLFLAPVYGVEPRKRLIEHMQAHAFNFFQNRQSGALGNKIHQGVIGLRLGLWTFVFLIWPIAIKFIVASLLIFMADKEMGVVLAAWCLVYFAVVAKIASIKYKIVTRMSNERSRITGLVVDMASNIHSVKSFANEKWEQEKIDGAMNREIREARFFQLAREGMSWFYSAMSFSLMLGLLYMALNDYAAGDITVGDIAFIFSLILLLIEQCRGLSFTFSDFLEYMGQLRDGVDTIMKQHTLSDNAGADDININQGHVAFEDIHFSYGAEALEPVFNGLKLDVSAGQRIGLVGTSGAGKSTLVNLLMRFYDLNDGHILIDNQDIAKHTQGSLRNQIAVIPQDTSLFHRSLLENIRYGKLSATDDEVIKAAKAAHMHDFIKLLPDGYNTMVGERGLKLSGGQRQRIAIARAILKDAPILILDEATSALDSESEALIQDSLEGLMKGKTVIAIAHRLSTIANLDRLIVMEKGKIIEDGTHSELLKQKGTYARLWAMQSGGFLKES